MTLRFLAMVPLIVPVGIETRKKSARRHYDWPLIVPVGIETRRHVFTAVAAIAL